MKAKKNYHSELHAEQVFHIYNRTNNQELLFRNDENRTYFLRKYSEYLFPYVETYAYCLLRNHFHILIKVRSVEEIWNVVKKVEEKKRTKPQKAFLNMEVEERQVHKVLENQFLRLFTSYSMKFNRMWDRKGNLFTRQYNHLGVEDERHFAALIYYIHSNPFKHKIMADFTKYRWSSYYAFISNGPTKIEREKVLDWFGGVEAFKSFHQQDNDLEGIKDYFIEE